MAKWFVSLLVCLVVSSLASLGSGAPTQQLDTVFAAYEVPSLPHLPPVELGTSPPNSPTLTPTVTTEAPPPLKLYTSNQGDFRGGHGEKQNIEPQKFLNAKKQQQHSFKDKIKWRAVPVAATSRPSMTPSQVHDAAPISITTKTNTPIIITESPLTSTVSPQHTSASIVVPAITTKIEDYQYEATGKVVKDSSSVVASEAATATEMNKRMHHSMTTPSDENKEVFAAPTRLGLQPSIKTRIISAPTLASTSSVVIASATESSQPVDSETLTQTTVAVVAVDSAPDTAVGTVQDAINALPTAMPANPATDDEKIKTIRVNGEETKNNMKIRSTTSTSMPSSLITTEARAATVPATAIATNETPTIVKTTTKIMELLTERYSTIATSTTANTTPPITSAAEVTEKKDEEEQKEKEKVVKTIQEMKVDSTEATTKLSTAVSHAPKRKEHTSDDDNIKQSGLPTTLTAKLESVMGSEIATPTPASTSIPATHFRKKKMDVKFDKQQQHERKAKHFHNDDVVPNFLVHTSTSSPADESADRIIKLIDLERNDYKSIINLQTQQHFLKEVEQGHGQEQTNPLHSAHDDGHDGVKKTKKKQLIDKHYLVNTTAFVTDGKESVTTSAPLPFTTSKVVMTKHANDNADMPNITVTPLTLTESTKDMKSSFYVESVKNQKAEKLTTSSHTHSDHPSKQVLTPIHNGYLGPIHMEERTFTVVRGNQKSQSQHEHDTFIESELRAGRIVEIIAPTSLFELTATSTAATKATIATTKLEQNLDASITATASPNELESLTHVPQNTKLEHARNMQVLSTTVFQVPGSPMTTTTRLPSSRATTLGDSNSKSQSGYASLLPDGSLRTESRISDIQIEVYDSTVDSIVASTNFRDTDNSSASRPEVIGSNDLGTTRPPSAIPQERFTQYVVDRIDASTTKPNIIGVGSINVLGKPEPAAIEIHINVSEGLGGNGGEDLEFSYRQSDYNDNINANNFGIKSTHPILIKNYETNASTKANVTTSEPSDEILVVEIIDTGNDNSTEVSGSGESINPVFTFHSEADGDSDVKYFSRETIVKPGQSPSDELFMADLRKNENNFPRPPVPPPPPLPRKHNIDHDSDTIFYISNTEVKVGESLPTANYEQQQIRRSKLENQFFPANYLANSNPTPSKTSVNNMPHQQKHQYEEDLILSPLQNTADSLKIFRSPSNDGAPPLDVTYVGESVMEVEQSSGNGIVSGRNSISSAASATTTTVISSSYATQPTQTPDIIIQPAILPEMSIGVPVIGELPPQIELKEIDFMPDEANQLRSGVYESDIEENSLNGNDVDRLVESSIQYGGDLIDEGAGGGGGFDGVEGSYPFGDPAMLRRNSKQHTASEYAHFTVNHGVSNLRRDELGVDVSNSMETDAENATLRELPRKGGDNGNNDTFMNISYTVAESLGNATAFSVRGDPSGPFAGLEDKLDWKNFYTLIIGLVIVVLPVVVTVSMFCALRYLYSKYQASSTDSNDNTDAAQLPNGVAGGDSEQGGSTQPPSPTQSDNDKDIKSNKLNNLPSPLENNTSKPSKSNFNYLNVDEQSKSTYSSDLNIRSPKVQTTNKNQPTTIEVDSEICIDKMLSKSEPNFKKNDSVHGNYTGPNGSITKMTLKNNHLIVETEERNDISRNARETKMHYTTSDKDGIFVVEVARGVDSKAIPDSPVTESHDERVRGFDGRPTQEITASPVTETCLKTENEKLPKTHEKVQIHQPPMDISTIATADEIQRSLHQIEEVDEPTPSPNSAVAQRANTTACLEQLKNCNTGLSQSDLSSTSSADSNKRYTYGTQELYTVEHPGYGNLISTAAEVSPMNSNKAAYSQDRKPENGDSLEHTPMQGNDSTNYNENCTEQPRTINAQEVPTDAAPCDDEQQSHEIREQNASEASNVIVEEATEVEIHAEPTEQIDELEIIVDASATTSDSIPIDEATNCNQEHKFEPTPEVQPQFNEISFDSKHVTEAAIDVDQNCVDAEENYDSIMSLPDPPSTEEINQLSDFNSMDINQLDSLPPPPPPLTVEDEEGTGEKATDSVIEGCITMNGTSATQCNSMVEEEQLDFEQIPTVLTNGKAEEFCNGYYETASPVTLTPHHSQSSMTNEETIIEHVKNNGKTVQDPLTPPASPQILPSHSTPPASPQLHYSNGMCAPPSVLPTLVDVNGS